jgi:HAD superfamily hydrolase (TIGR01458 family)
MPLPAGFLIDLDGTLYTQSGAVPGAPALLRRLRDRGIPYRLVTNTSSRPRRLLIERLRGYGFEVAPSDLQTPVQAAADILAARGHRRVAAYVPAPTLEDFAEFDLVRGSDRAPTAVVVGDLGEEWTYALLQEAFTHVMGGAELVALSRDRYWLRADGLALDAGPFVVGLEYASSRTAVVTGKPSPDFYQAAVRGLGLGERADPRDVVMVGDDLWSDVQGAQHAGLQGWLVRTGKFREEQLHRSGVTPDRILDSVAELI